MNQFAVFKVLEIKHQNAQMKTGKMTTEDENRNYVFLLKKKEEFKMIKKYTKSIKEYQK
ncbi:MAG: hypothetical protein ACLVJ6_10555 [Merdibacter sp.]